MDWEMKKIEKIVQLMFLICLLKHYRHAMRCECIPPPRKSS